MSLTAQQETFAQGLAKGLSQAEAYRQAYPRSRKWTEKSLYTRAGRLARNAEVLRRVWEIRQPVIAKAQYELEDAMAEADQAIALALKEGNPSAMVSAVALKAKLNGLFVEDRKNQRRPLQDMTDEQLDEIIKGRARDAGITLQ